MRSSLSVLQPRAHTAKPTLPAKPKFSIGEQVHYRDFTRNRPKWAAGKVTGYVGNQMFIVQGPGGHCRRHEDQLKLHSVPKLNRQRRQNRSAAFDSERNTKTDQHRYDNGVPELTFTNPTRPRTKNCLLSLINLCHLVVRLVLTLVFHQ